MVRMQLKSACQRPSRSVSLRHRQLVALGRDQDERQLLVLEPLHHLAVLARRLVAAEIMAAVYRAMLDRIEARHYDVFSTTIRVPRPRRALIALTTWLRVVAGVA